MIERAVPCPWPDDPVLREAAIAYQDAGHYAWVFDSDWRIVFMSDDSRLSWASNDGDYAPVAVGHHLFSPQSVAMGDEWRYGLTSIELWRGFFQLVGGLVLHDTPGGRDELRALVEPSLADLVDEVEPDGSITFGGTMAASGLGTIDSSKLVLHRLRDADGELAGIVMTAKPPAGMSTLIGLSWYHDLDHLERMERFTEAGRQPAAVLFADLEGSSHLSRTMSTASYFALGRRLVRAADQCVVDAGGLVGRHVGDGVVAFFPTLATGGSESTAARSCIEAARALRATIGDVAARSGLADDDVVLRFGLHWGSTLYIGRITTSARAEVTALGDQVNEAARIEACATGGRTLASKDLVERLDPTDAEALGLDPDRLSYIQLGELVTATDKARRDAPAIAVCEV
jgi:class 3 adenylate cyclase